MKSIKLFFSKVPAFLNVVDIAGLVKGASEGQVRKNYIFMAFICRISNESEI